MLLFATVSQPWQLVYVLIVFGIGHGGVIPVRSSIYAEYFGLKALGSIQGLALTTQTVGGFLGPIFAGVFYDQSDSYRLAFLLLAVAPLIGAPLVLSARKPQWPDDGLVA
jgi:MFS family permease